MIIEILAIVFFGSLFWLIGDRIIQDFNVRKIYGCHADLYMTRIILVRFKSGAKLMINYFHRSDENREFHDHPWNFRSLILWRGYHEHHPGGVFVTYPGMLIRRPAQWRHRVTLKSGRPACTLVLTGPYIRDWGFHTDHGWVQWEKFGRMKGCD
jgi:hypothetical protein